MLMKTPPYMKPKKPSYTRRARHHDYHCAARYMITLKKAPEIPILSRITGDPKSADSAAPEFPRAVPTPVGECFEKALTEWIRRYPQMRVDPYVIMPDHIHFRLHVTDDIPSGLSTAIASLMGQTTNQYKELLSRSNTNFPEDLRYFHKGYTDSIAYDLQQFDTQRVYITDNPRRLLIKRQHPDFFFARWLLHNESFSMIAIGNIYLLKNPHIEHVRFSRKFSEQQNLENRAAWVRCVENEGVLISPFIHPVEKEMRDYAIKNEGKIIRFEHDGFSERYSPSKIELELLAEGRLLLLGPVEHNTEKTKLTRNMSMQLNAIARWLATYPTNLRIRRIR